MSKAITEAMLTAFLSKVDVQRTGAIRGLEDGLAAVLALSVPLPEIEGGGKGDGWQPIETAPVDHEPIGYVSTQTLSELLHDNSGEYKITASHDLMSDDMIAIYTAPDAHPGTTHAPAIKAETLYRWRGPKGGWIYDAKKPSWHSERLEVRAAPSASIEGETHV